MTGDGYRPTERTRVRRLAKRAAYDRATVHAILDQGFICHVAFVVDGSPVVLPTAYGRAGERLFIHGSAANRMLSTAAKGVDIAVAVTLVDGLVLARSAFHHSINYRSVVLFGRARLLADPAEKNEALRVISEHIIRGRWEQVRPPSEKELSMTSVIAVELDEVSAKVRTGPPLDDADDMDYPVWAGVLPLLMEAGAPVPDGDASHAPAIPEYIRNYRRRT
ncbi:MAG TPA: pyridoxamine 5'-phosphate oxidase family protein [Bryobacteraceae bacterium]|nr:pyridoxamine 5'-phosphate oxidase family protein [Bryobacteraceae bacterium]